MKAAPPKAAPPKAAPPKAALAEVSELNEAALAEVPELDEAAHEMQSPPTEVLTDHSELSPVCAIADDDLRGSVLAFGGSSEDSDRVMASLWELHRKNVKGVVVLLDHAAGRDAWGLLGKRGAWPPFPQAATPLSFAGGRTPLWHRATVVARAALADCSGLVVVEDSTFIADPMVHLHIANFEGAGSPVYLQAPGR